MKTKIIFFITVIFFIIISCVLVDKRSKPSNDSEINSSLSLPKISTLTNYSWKKCKQYIRMEDYTLYDVSEQHLLDICDTIIYTFGSDSSFLQKAPCESSPIVKYWQYNSNKNKINIYYDEQCTDYDYSYILEEISNDSLKLFLVPIDNPNEQIAGNIIYFYSIKKITKS